VLGDHVPPSFMNFVAPTLPSAIIRGYAQPAFQRNASTNKQRSEQIRMWIKKTVNEMEILKRNERIRSIRNCIIGGLVCIPFGTFIEGWNNNFQPAVTLFDWTLYLTPADEWLHRMPISFIAGCFLVILIRLLYPQATADAFVCVKCGSIKTRKIPSCIFCGGSYERLSEMKWVADEDFDSKPASEKTKCLSCNSVILKTEETCPYCKWPNKYTLPNKSNEPT